MANENLDRALDQLDRVLGFFSRAEGKATFLFALDGAALALMAGNLNRGELNIWYIAAPGVLAALLFAASVVFTYRCIFPSLEGGASSLIYFREIAKRTEANFIADVTAVSEDALARDAWGQVWRNSEILTKKFDSVKTAFFLAVLALIPMAFYLGAIALTHDGGMAFKP